MVPRSTSLEILSDDTLVIVVVASSDCGSVWSVSTTAVLISSAPVSTSAWVTL